MIFNIDSANFHFSNLLTINKVGQKSPACLQYPIAGFKFKTLPFSLQDANTSFYHEIFFVGWQISSAVS